jgi:hypothetical protein
MSDLENSILVTEEHQSSGNFPVKQLTLFVSETVNVSMLTVNLIVFAGGEKQT